MTTYNLPKEPSGPVWDNRGKKWEKGVRHWKTEGVSLSWAAILEYYEPLSDSPPVKVGDKITLTEFSKMPDYSIAGTPREVFINFDGGVFTDRKLGEFDLWEFGDDEVTVLRVGDGE